MPTLPTLCVTGKLSPLIFTTNLRFIIHNTYSRKFTTCPCKTMGCLTGISHRTLHILWCAASQLGSSGKKLSLIYPVLSIGCCSEVLLTIGRSAVKHALISVVILVQNLVLTKSGVPTLNRKTIDLKWICVIYTIILDLRSFFITISPNHTQWDIGTFVFPQGKW